MMGDEGVDSVVVQSDRIKHTSGSFDGSPGGIAGAGLFGDCLRQNAAQTRQVNQRRHLASVAKGPRSYENRVGQPQATKLDA
jgi:hypothetical protein